MSRSASAAFPVAQIVPGCSVKRRKSTPYPAWTTSGTIHHSEASVPSRPMRSRKPAESRQRTDPTTGS